MAQVKVTVKETHYGSFGLMKAGQTYNVASDVAQLLVNSGLVTSDGMTAKGAAAPQVLTGSATSIAPVAAKPADTTTKTPIHTEKGENIGGNVPTATVKV